MRFLPPLGCLLLAACAAWMRGEVVPTPEAGAPAVEAAARSEDLPASAWAAALADFERGRVAEAAAVCLAQTEPPPDAATGFEVTRLLIYAGRPVEALRFAKRLEKVFPEQLETRLARTLALLRVGAAGESTQAARALTPEIKRPGAVGAYTIYLLLRRNAWTGGSKVPKAMVDRMLAEAKRYTEFWLVAADWAERNGQDELAGGYRDRFVQAAPAYDEKLVARVRASRELARKRGTSDIVAERVQDVRVEWPMTPEPLPLILLSINGGEPAPFVLDTGANLFVLDEAWARAQRLVPAGKAPHLSTTTGELDAEITVLEKVSAPGMELRGVAATLVDLEPIREATRKAPDEYFPEAGVRELFLRFRGVVGAELLAEDRVLWFDVPGRRVVIAPDRDQAAPGKKFGGDRMMMDGLPYLPAEVADGPEGLFLLDTGANSAASISPEFASLGGWAPKPASGDAWVAGGAGLMQQAHEVDAELKLAWWGSDFVLRVQDAPVSTHTAQNFHAVMEAGKIGWPILRQLSPAFDYKTGRLSLINKSDAEPAAEPAK